MRRFSLLRSTPFRLALTFACLFVCTFLLSGIIAFQLMRTDLSQRLDETAKETFTVIAATYAEGDLEDLVAAVESHSNAAGQLFSLIDAGGNRLAGNFAANGVSVGFSNIDDRVPGVSNDASYRAYSGPVGANTLTVALGFAETERLENIILLSFGWATLIVTGLAVVGGAWLASRVQRRLDAIAATMVAVSHGKLGARIPLIGNGDDVDGVSAQVNGALERLSALVEGMKQVSSDIAHDLKTPLNRLQMILEGAGDKAANGQNVSGEMAEALAESRHINGTFEALLRIAQIEAGARKARFKDLDLGDVVSTIAEIYADVAEDDVKTLSAAIEPHEAAGQIHGDWDLLTQMFSNLVENSLRHCPDGTRIELSMSRSGDRVVATVADNGPGIPAEESEKVFQRLYRLNKSRSTPGNGLGLSLVRAISDLHGATINLEDRRPGLAVVVSFPAAGSER